jgi:hypothetical protein
VQQATEPGAGSEAAFSFVIPRPAPADARWTRWTLGYAWLVGTMAVQFFLGWLLFQVGKPLDGVMLSVGAAGLGLGLVGSLVLWRLESESHAAPSSVVIETTLGAGALGFAGFCAADSAPVGALFAGGTALVVTLAMDLAYLLRNRRGSKRTFAKRGCWVFASGVVVVALSACFAFLPSGPSLRFRFQDEGRLDSLVRVVASKTAPVRCTSTSFTVVVPVFGRVSQDCYSSYAEFDANEQSEMGSYGFVFAPGMAPRQLRSGSVPSSASSSSTAPGGSSDQAGGSPVPAWLQLPSGRLRLYGPGPTAGPRARYGVALPRKTLPARKAMTISGRTTTATSPR